MTPAPQPRRRDDSEENDRRDERRIIRVPIRMEQIEPLFRGDLAVIERLPDDVRFVRSYHDPMRDELYLIMRSQQFDPVDVEEVIPLHEPEVRHLSDEQAVDEWGRR